MYYKAFFLILIIMTICISPSFAFAEESNSISTNLDTYTQGEDVIVFGKIVKIIQDLPLTVQIFHNTNLIDVAQIPVAQDGSFAHTFKTLGPLWSSDGAYTVRGFYTVDQVMETEFQFITLSTTTDSQIFSVNIPNSGVFDLPYTITGGKIKEIVLNNDSYSILINTTTEANGVLKLKLPRESFDSKKDNGADDIFIIMIKDKDGNIFEALYEEVEKTDDFRVVEIKFEPGDKSIEIFGTYVIPEFGSIVSMVLLASLASVIIISKNKFASIYNWKF